MVKDNEEYIKFFFIVILAGWYKICCSHAFVFTQVHPVRFIC